MKLATLLLGLALAWPLPGQAAATQELQVHKLGESYQVDASLLAPVPLLLAWNVLTDFDAMAAFVPNLEQSRVTERGALRVLLWQEGEAHFGPFAHRFESLRRIDLQPYSLIRSSQLHGTLRKMESVTTLTEVAGGTRITYRVELVPALSMPGFMGEAVVRHEVREQLEAIVAEMVRRQSSRPPR